MSTAKPFILIIDKDSDFSDALIRICEALNLEAEVMQTHSNATRAYAARRPSAVFLSPDLNMVDPRALVEDLSAIAHAQKFRPTPILFVTHNSEELTRVGLKGLPGTGVIEKPINLELIYSVFEKLSLVQLEVPHPSSTSRGKIKDWKDFLNTNDEWLTNLVSKLGT